MPKFPSVRDVNVLYLIVFVLLATIGNLIQTRLSHWGSIISQLLLILAPALLFMRLKGLPLRETLRLHRPGRVLAFASILLGLCVSLLAPWVNVLIYTLFKFYVGVPPEYYPTTPLEGVLVLLSSVVLAPICEEVLFRGVIQRAYERRRPRAAFIIVGLMFVIIHLRFWGAAPILPIALVLGYLVWRAESIIPAMLAHATYNLIPTLMVINYAQRPSLSISLAEMLLTCWPIALIITIVYIGVFHFFTTDEMSGRRITVPQATELVKLSPGAWLAQVWPLFFAAAIYIFFAYFEFTVGRSPERFVVDRLELQPAPWKQSYHWEYDLYSYTEKDLVGHADCQLTPQQAEYILDYHIVQSSSVLRIVEGRYVGGEMDQRHVVHWAADDLSLLSFETIPETTVSRGVVKVTLTDGSLHLLVSGLDGTINKQTLPSDAFLSSGGAGSVVQMGEWPWRLSALPFAPGAGYWVTFVQPDRWGEEGESGAPVVEEIVVFVNGAISLPTPVGNYMAWEVVVGDRFAVWYDVEPPHTLLRYEDPRMLWLLVGVK